MNKLLYRSLLGMVFLGPLALLPGLLAQSATEEADLTADKGWPRKLSKDGNVFSIYQPQVEKWENNRLECRAAVAVETKASPQPTFGVVWFTARTEIDREYRQVILDEFKITRANFPAAEKGDEYLTILRTVVPTGSKVVSLDRLQANLHVTQAEAKVQKLPIKNEPPRVIFSTQPALLILIDGKPALRQTDDKRFLRVINTRALLVLDQVTGKYYLHAVDHWLLADAVTGPWSIMQTPATGLEELKKSLADNPQVDLLDDPAPDIKELVEGGKMPTIYVSTEPAELVETRGPPEVAPIDGTNLLWVKNTSDEIVMDLGTQDYYVLLSGRWFRSKSLRTGPWEFVPGDKVPADFAKIPENHPKGDVLATVAGTPQAKESLIAQRIPQTATIKRGEAKFDAVYDGDPKFDPIEETKLQYAINSPTPIIQVDARSYYAVENGVWFTAPGPNGPWTVATSVPPSIYTIPVSSPVYNVTNVQVYDSTPEVVYVGYSPGYFGSVWAPWGTVVYGTGWYYRPWINRYWFGRPWSYGFGVRFNWNTAGGWCYGFGAAVGRPWWGPVGWRAGAGGVWREGWNHGWGGRYNNVHFSNVHVNNFNVYNRWNTNALVNHRGNVVAAQKNTNIVGGRNLNNVYAGHDGNVYRRAENNWQTTAKAGQWQNVQANHPQVQNLNQQHQVRQQGGYQTNQFHSSGGFGGYSGYRPSGGASGYRGGGGRRR